MPRFPVAGPVVIPGCIQVNLFWTSSNRRWRNVLHGNLTAAGPVNPILAETLFTAFKGGLTSSGWVGELHTNSALTGVGIKDLRQQFQVEYLSTSAPMAGQAAGIELPLNVALVVTLQTALAGRQNRGRTYLTGFTDGALNGPLQTGAVANTAATAFLQAIQSAMQANTIPMVVAQRALAAGTDKKGNPLPPRVAGVQPVVNITVVNPRVDSQRRRLGR